MESVPSNFLRVIIKSEHIIDHSDDEKHPSENITDQIHNSMSLSKVTTENIDEMNLLMCDDSVDEKQDIQSESSIIEEIDVDIKESVNSVDFEMVNLDTALEIDDEMSDCNQSMNNQDPLDISNDINTEELGVSVTNELLVKIKKKESINSLISQAMPMDSRQLRVPSSNNKNNHGGTKKHFCQFCKKLQAKYTRHVVTQHSNIEEVKRCINIKDKRLQKKAISDLMKQGDYLHNTNPELNTGVVIVSRRPQAKYKKAADEFVVCSNCLAYFSVKTLRIHYKVCKSEHKKGERGQKREGRFLTGYIHPSANEVMRQKIFPKFHDDDVARMIQYDGLLIIYGNMLCGKYTTDQLFNVLRNHLRLLARLTIEMKKINNEIDDFASIFHSKYFNDIIKVVKMCGNYENKNIQCSSSYNPTMIRVHLQKCGRLLAAECVQKQNLKRKKEIESFLLKLAKDYNTSLRKKAVDGRKR